MLTPKEIEDKIFSKGIRGYNCLEVDSFLDDVILDYEKLLNENDGLKLELKLLKENLKDEKDPVKVTKKANIDLTEDDKANEIIVEAEMKARNIIEEANEKIKFLKEKEEILKQEIVTTSKGYKVLLEESLASIKKYEEVDKLRNRIDFVAGNEGKDKSKVKYVEETPFTFDDLKKETKVVKKEDNAAKVNNGNKVDIDFSKKSEAKTILKSKETVLYDDKALEEMLDNLTVKK